ncbi:hypothetical protein vseg_013975 [Gypsophila vaccaria]
METLKITKMFQRQTNKITKILTYVVLEWTLIFLLLVNSILSYFVIKFALYFGLSPPCLFCNRLEQILKSRETDDDKKNTTVSSFSDLICEQHASELCSLHKKLVESKNLLCSECSPPPPAPPPPEAHHNSTMAGPLLSWMNGLDIVKSVGDEEEDDGCARDVEGYVGYMADLITDREMEGCFPDQGCRFDSSGYIVLDEDEDEDEYEDEEEEEEEEDGVKEPLLSKVEEDVNVEDTDDNDVNDICSEMMMQQHLEFYVDHDDYRLIPVESDGNSVKVEGKSERSCVRNDESSEICKGEDDFVIEKDELMSVCKVVSSAKNLPSILEAEEEVEEEKEELALEAEVAVEEEEEGVEEDSEVLEVGTREFDEEKSEVLSDCGVKEEENCHVFESINVLEDLVGELQVIDDEVGVHSASEVYKEEMDDSHLCTEVSVTNEVSVEVSEHPTIDDNEVNEHPKVDDNEVNEHPTVDDNEVNEHPMVDDNEVNEVPMVDDNEVCEVSHSLTELLLPSTDEIVCKVEMVDSHLSKDELVANEELIEVSEHPTVDDNEVNELPTVNDDDEMNELRTVNDDEVVEVSISSVELLLPSTDEIDAEVDAEEEIYIGTSTEVNEDRLPDTPNSTESLNMCEKMQHLGRMGSVTEESVEGSSIKSDQNEGGDATAVIEKLKSEVESERKTLRALYKELEEERNAAAIAANQTLAMINRLQEEKATMQMEALQYQRMMEEQSEYDQEALQMMNELMVKREKEKLELEKEIEVYRKKLSDFEEREKIRILSRRMEGSFRGSRNSSASCSFGEESDGLSVDLNHEVKDHEEDGGISQENGHQDTPVDSVLNLQQSLGCFEDERQSILEQLKVLEEKLFTLAEEEEEEEEEDEDNTDNVRQYEGLYEENGKEFDEENGGENGLAHVVGKHQEGWLNGSMPKRLLPLFDAAELSSSPDRMLDLAVHNKLSITKFELEKKRLAIEEEVDHVYERLHALEADREFLKHCVGSLRKGDKGLDLLQEILQHLRDLKNVELQVMKNSV